jgi:hypothetical protein
VSEIDRKAGRIEWFLVLPRMYGSSKREIAFHSLSVKSVKFNNKTVLGSKVTASFIIIKH